jgi:hypothetical protein
MSSHGLVPERRVWLDQTQSIVGGFDARRNLVLEQRRRGLPPMRRYLDPAELAVALNSGRLRPVGKLPEKAPNP